jgi:hypothetical protein
MLRAKNANAPAPNHPADGTAIIFILNIQHSEFQVTRLQNKNRFATNEPCSLSLGSKHKNDE